MFRFISILSSAVFVSFSDASLLRGWNQNDNAPRSTQSLTDDTFDCYIYEVDGIAPPGSLISPQWSCELEATDNAQGKTFTFTGDIDGIMRKNFGEDITNVLSARMTVPWEAVSESTIISGHEGIKISHDSFRHARHLASQTGNQQVLIVRVIDRKGRAPELWKKHIKGFFFQDSNNLKTRLKECSMEKLNLVPATGPEVDHGVINIRVDLDIFDMSWQKVGQEVTNQLKSISGLNYATRIYIMPDDVNFGGAAAWAQVGGNTIWMRDKYASYPIVQVHEYGHLLGQRHSGKNGGNYNDNSCYMGNQVPWNEEGAFMCFNAAKTWHLNWYSEFNKEIDPASNAFNGDLVGIDDAAQGKAGLNNVVVKVNGVSQQLFVMYNRKKGINRGALGGSDKVIITKQNARNKDSDFVKELDAGEVTKIVNFSGNGKTLVVKNCHMTENNGNADDTARVLIYIEGLNEQQCGEIPPGGNPGTGGGNPGTVNCVDKTWVDNFGDGCSWYAKSETRCNLLADIKGTNGWTVSDACCTCGGGNNGETTNGGGNNGETTNGEENNDDICTDVEGWHDKSGETYNCQWYADNNVCQAFGHLFENDGLTANQACCACGKK